MPPTQGPQDTNPWCHQKTVGQVFKGSWSWPCQVTIPDVQVWVVVWLFCPACLLTVRHTPQGTSMFHTFFWISLCRLVDRERDLWRWRHPVCRLLLIAQRYREKHHSFAGKSRHSVGFLVWRCGDVQTLPPLWTPCFFGHHKEAFPDLHCSPNFAWDALCSCIMVEDVSSQITSPQDTHSPFFQVFFLQGVSSEITHGGLFAFMAIPGCQLWLVPIGGQVEASSDGKKGYHNAVRRPCSKLVICTALHRLRTTFSLLWSRTLNHIGTQNHELCFICFSSIKKKQKHNNNQSNCKSLSISMQWIADGISIDSLRNPVDVLGDSCVHTRISATKQRLVVRSSPPEDENNVEPRQLPVRNLTEFWSPIFRWNDCHFHVLQRPSNANRSPCFWGTQQTKNLQVIFDTTCFEPDFALRLSEHFFLPISAANAPGHNANLSCQTIIFYHPQRAAGISLHMKTQKLTHLSLWRKNIEKL